MKSLNKSQDVTKYLHEGSLTAPFLADEELKLELKLVEKKLKRKKEEYALEDCILCFVHANLKFDGEDKALARQKYSRTAAQIFKSHKAASCTDFAYVFATLARQMGIPTTILRASQKEWANKLINNLDGAKSHKGHTFCECFLSGKWVLVDPANSRIDWKYESGKDKIKLEDKILDSITFLPYFRGLDFETKMTQKEFFEKEEAQTFALFKKKYGTEEVKKRYKKIKTPQELKEFMDDVFTYGFFDDKGVEHTSTMKGIDAHQTLSVEDMFKYKYETCAEAAKFAKHWFTENGYECKLFFERIKRHDLDENKYYFHNIHFLILFKEKNGVWCRFEQSSSDSAGIYVLGSFEKAKKHIIDYAKETRQNQIDFNKGKNVDFNTFGLYEIDDIEDGSSFKSINEKTKTANNIWTEEKENKKE